jgi:tetratricopeptide (TPR) repeat protein
MGTIMPDTESARDDLRIARQYIDRHYDDKKISWSRDLDFAMKYVQRAQQKDRFVTLKAKGNDKGKVIDWTPDGMEGEILAIHGISCSNLHSREDYSEAIPLLEQSIKLFPMPPAYKALANSYNGMARREDALSILQEGARKWPGNMEIQETIDMMEANPSMGRSKSASRYDTGPNHRLWVILSGVGLLLLSVMVGCATTGGNDSNAILPTIGIFISFAIIYIGFKYVW